MLKNISLILVLLMLSTKVFSASIEQIQKVSKEVLELCRGGSFEGRSSTLTANGEGKIEAAVLKKLVDLGVSGNFSYTDTEWKGIKAVVPSEFKHEVHSECVVTMTKFFTEAIEPKKTPKLCLERCKIEYDTNKTFLKRKFSRCLENSREICIDQCINEHDIPKAICITQLCERDSRRNKQNWTNKCERKVDEIVFSNENDYGVCKDKCYE